MKASSFLILIFSLISFSLQGQTGFIDLKSEPSGATIYIDNISKGKTPKIIELNPGKHRLRLEFDEYEPSSMLIEVVEGMVLRENIKLKAYGKLSVTSKPSGSEVYVDNKKLKQKTPISNHFISAGNHTVKVTNYRIKGLENEGVSVSRNISIQSRQTRTLNINLYNELGAAKITSTPNADISINWRPKEKTPHTYENLIKGEYRINFTAYLDDPYFEEFNILRKINISPKTTSILDVNFYEEFKLGTLSFKSTENWDFEIERLHSDYKKTITTSTHDFSLENIQLVNGEYVLKWVDPGRNEIAFNIFDNQNTSIFAPVKRELNRELTLLDLPDYLSESHYITKYHNYLPESKIVSRIGYSYKEASKSNSIALNIGVYVGGAGMILGLIGGATENAEVGAIGGAMLGTGILLAPFYKKEKVKPLKSNIRKNHLQKEKLKLEYDQFQSKLEKDLIQKNDEIQKRNKRNSEYNEGLAPAEVKYESK